MIWVEEVNKTGRLIPQEAKLYWCHYFMTSGGIPLNHHQDVSTNRAQLFYGFMRNLLKRWNVTGRNRRKQPRAGALGPQVQAFREVDKQILAAHSAQYLWAPLTPADCRKGAPSRGHSDTCSHGCRPARDSQRCHSRHILFPQSSPKSFYAWMLLVDVFWSLTLPNMFLWSSLSTVNHWHSTVSYTLRLDGLLWLPEGSVIGTLWYMRQYLPSYICSLIVRREVLVLTHSVFKVTCCFMLHVVKWVKRLCQFCTFCMEYVAKQLETNRVNFLEDFLNIGWQPFVAECTTCT